MTGGASRTARLQYLSAPEPGGHQPRNRHDVNDPLLLALQKELTSNLLWVLVILLLPQQSAQWAEKKGTLPTNGKDLADLVEVNKKCPPQTP